MDASRLQFAIPAGFLLALLLSESAWTLEAEKDHASWWIEMYGLAHRESTPYLDRAEVIFPRVAAAADKRANRLPKLVVLNAKGSPFAMALPDGSVLLTKGALEVCYRNPSLEVGDSRLAFVIGHELAHLGNDDFWHAAAFEALEQHGTDSGGGGDRLMDLMNPSEDDAKRREIHADVQGMLYMTIAGFDPDVLFGEQSFFAEWAAQLSKLGLRIASEQATPEERSAMVMSQAAAIASALDFYHFGVRLVQIGRFQDGLLLLEHFRDRFPSREVLNNIGYAHFQLGVQHLGACDGRLIVRFKLPTLIDPSTRVSHLRSGSTESPCFENRTVKRHLEEAERNLEEAASMDSAYLPARLNLFSVYAIAGKGAQALVAAEEAVEIDDDDLPARGARALALYLYGEQSGLATADAAIEQLEGLLREAGKNANLAYNRAAMLSERRRVQTAREAFSRFLTLEPRGIFADAARDYLEDPSPAKGAGAPPPYVPEPPVKLGPLSKSALEAKLRNVRFSDFAVGSFSGVFIHFAGGRALAIGSTIEFVEERMEPPLAEPAAARYGESIAKVEATTERILLYPGFGLVSQSSGIVGRLYFAE